MKLFIRSLKGKGWFGTAIAVALVAVLFAISYVRANDTADVDWINRVPSVVKERDYDVRPDFAMSKCQPTNVQVYGESGFRSLCMTQTAMGPMTRLYDFYNYVQPNGYAKAYQIDFRRGGNPIIEPLPNQASGLYIAASDTGTGLTMGLTYQISNHMTPSFTPFLSGYTIPAGHTVTDMIFSHPSGEAIQFKQGYEFSQNGRYIIANSKHGIMRINAMNPNIQFFAPENSYAYGTQLQFAISNSGGYAAVSVSRPNQPSDSSLKVVDINSCDVPVPEARNTPNSAVSFDSCKTVDLFPSIKQVLPSAVGVNKPQFVNEHTLTVVVTYKDANNVSKYALFSLTAGGQSLSLKNYLALGDSYSSGEGAHTYREGTDTVRNQCHQSLLSYPYLLGASQGSFAAVTCSGARMHNVRPERGVDTYQIKGAPTASEMDGALENYMPGVLAQKEFVTENNPEAITISIGGNDIGFGSILEKCVHPLKHLEDNLVSNFTCYDTYEDRLEVVNMINSQFTRLRGLYEGLRDNGINGRRVYVIGYPQIAKVGGVCGLNVAMNTEEVKFAYDLIDYLNSVIRRAAEEAGVQYVDTQQAFEGSRLCEAVPGQSAMNGFTINKSLNGGYDFKASFHPNQKGHQLLAQTIASQTQNLTKPMPDPKPKTNKIDIDTNAAVLQNVPKTNRQLNAVTIVNGLVDKVVRPSLPVSIFMSAKDFLTKPDAEYRLVLNSTPVNLGNYRSDTNGDISITTTMPAGVTPGFHTLHLYGTDMMGNPIDIQQVVFMAASETDFDGDGIPNSTLR